MVATSRKVKLGACALLFALATTGLAACGGSGEEITTTRTGETIRGPSPPKGASPLLLDLYRNFQPPLADPATPGSAEAMRKGERACRGKTPVKVTRRYLGESELAPSQREALDRLPTAEAHPTSDFAAGQLAALVYEGTLSGETAPYGFKGCIYALAQGLKRELAP